MSNAVSTGAGEDFSCGEYKSSDDSCWNPKVSYRSASNAAESAGSRVEADAVAWSLREIGIVALEYVGDTGG